MPATDLTGLRAEAIAALDEMRREADQLTTDASTIEQVAAEEGRHLTEEENTQIEQLIAQAVQLSDEYEERLKEEQRAAARATIEVGVERLATLPEVGNVGLSPAQRRVQTMRSRFYDDPKRGFNDIGEFCAIVWASGMPNAIADDRINRIRMEAQATGMSQGVGADGGILVPPSFRQEIWLGMQNRFDNIMQMTDQFTVTGESLTIPASAEVSRKNGSRYGGVQGFWIAEAEQITQSRPRVRQMKLEPQELAVLVYVTDKLLRNAPALNAYVSRAAGDEIMFKVNDTIINGLGVGQPLGVLNAGGLITVAKESGQAANTIVTENVNNMWARMYAPARAGAVWFINQDVETALEALVPPGGGGNYGFPVYMPQGAGGPTIVESPNARLKGRPVIPVEYCETLGTVGDIILMNPLFYAMGVKGAIRDDMSMHLRFDYAETAFRFMFEIDGQPWANQPLTPYKGTITQSAYLALETRS